MACLTTISVLLQPGRYVCVALLVGSALDRGPLCPSSITARAVAALLVCVSLPAELTVLLVSLLLHAELTVRLLC